mgnify:CR=1 FL=1
MGLRTLEMVLGSPEALEMVLGGPEALKMVLGGPSTLKMVLGGPEALGNVFCFFSSQKIHTLKQNKNARPADYNFGVKMFCY